jgi:hypothetical protein
MGIVSSNKTRVSETEEKKAAKKKKFDRLVLIESFLISLVIAIILFFLIYMPILFYVHEGGHILGGVINDIKTGRPIQNYSISNWIPTGIPFISLPQQTSGPGSALSILGGPYFEILFFTIITAIIYFKFHFKTKEWLVLIPIYVIITEIVNNYICGTDNLSNKPLSMCQDNGFISFYFSWNFLLLIAIFFIIVYPLVKVEMPYWIDKILTFRGYKQEYL